MYLSAQRKILIFFSTIFFLFFSSLVYSQETFKPNSTFNKLDNFKDSAPAYSIYPYNKKRIRLATTANIVGYGGTLIGLNAIWYAKYPRSGFHFFNDNAEWLQMDKAGIFTARILKAMQAWNFGVGQVYQEKKESGLAV